MVSCQVFDLLYFVDSFVSVLLLEQFIDSRLLQIDSVNVLHYLHFR